jgi:anti-anti-sigma regulatory factor
MLRIQRSTEGNKVVFALSGRIGAEDLAELQSLLQSEVGDHHLVLDLKDVKLVNCDAVKFLAHYEADGAKLKNCPAYIREWITREREASNKGKGEEPSKV